VETLDILSPLVFAGLLIGGVLPFLFTAYTMKAVGRARSAWWKRSGVSSGPFRA